MSTTATTRLEAVNIMLSVIGEAPVSTLSGNASVDVAMAQVILDEVDKETQMEGWHFNTEREVALVPDHLTGKITLPSNAIRIDAPDGMYGELDLTARGLVLYDKNNHTDTFSTYQSIKLDIVYLLTFEQLPEACRAYIITRSARKLQDRLLGAQEHHSYNMRDESQARVRLMDMESDTGDYSIFDSYSVSRIIDRPYPPRRLT